MYNFKNDYNTIGHPKLLQVLVDFSNEENEGYGLDDISLTLEKKVQKMVKENVSVYLLSGGTLTNLIALSKMLKPYEAVIAAESGHINVHETGSIEATGHKIIPVKSIDGKIESSMIEKVMMEHHDFHMVKPKVVYISNSTEVGTIYTKDELLRLSKVCKKYDLYLYLDGARLAQALTANDNDLSLKDITELTDAYYLGGTKNGLPYGEMLIIKNKEINESFRYHLKSKGGVFSKTFVLAYLFNKYLEDDFYLSLAKHANNQAEYLRFELQKENITEVFPNHTNQIFIKVKKEVAQKLAKNFLFEIWQEDEDYQIIRLVTSYHTQNFECDALIKALA